VVHCFIGTKAQCIKMAPVLVELRRRGVPCRCVDSGQHAERTASLRRTFGLPEPDVRLRAEGGDIASVGAAATWFLRQSWRTFADPARLRRHVFPGGGICLVHGDTLSTLLGVRMARRAGLHVGHVEAGLRSFRTWDPFPEELIRVYCTKRAHLLFAPSDQAAEQLARRKLPGRIVRVSGNTVADALRLMEHAPTSVRIPDDPFALAACHRFETLMNKGRLRRVVALVNRVAAEMEVLFVMHGPTRTALERAGLSETLLPSVTQTDLLDYPDFVALLRSARLVLSDGGSIQEECAYLNRPLLILRDATERPDGLGDNAALWAFDDETAERFLQRAMERPPLEPPELPRPSAEIVQALLDMGHGSNS
jgi:UDP-N-acetylglucosamine 2-epimerase